MARWLAVDVRRGKGMTTERCTLEPGKAIVLVGRGVSELVVQPRMELIGGEDARYIRKSET